MLRQCMYFLCVRKSTYHILIPIQAAAIDDSDVTLWYKIGKLAVKLGNLRLARYSFEQVCIKFTVWLKTLDSYFNMLFKIERNLYWCWCWC